MAASRVTVHFPCPVERVWQTVTDLMNTAWRGDLARVDEDGYYFLTGRKKNVIILDSGENVSPEELEGLLEKCPAVKECLVKEKGKKICAVVCCEEADQQTVRDFITETNRTLPLYKRMSAVEFSAQPLPRNAMGKLMR